MTCSSSCRWTCRSPSSCPARWPWPSWLPAISPSALPACGKPLPRSRDGIPTSSARARKPSRGSAPGWRAGCPPSPLPSRSPGRSAGWVEGVPAALIRRLALGRIPVHEGAHEHGVRVAPHFVLDHAEDLARVDVHDLLEAILIVLALFADEPVLVEPLVGTGEVRDVDGDVIAVVGGNGRAGLPEHQLLALADSHVGGHALGVGRHRGGSAHDLLVEARDAGRAPGLDGEFDMGDAEGHVAERGAGRVEAEAVAPRRGHRDVLVLDAVGTLGAREE